jgi:hypothetical protein
VCTGIYKNYDSTGISEREQNIIIYMSRSQPGTDDHPRVSV